MISKSTIKLIKSLALKKYRKKENLFLVEGDKMVAEVLQSKLTVKELIITPNFKQLQGNDLTGVEKVTEVSNIELKQCSLLQNPQNSIAICRIPEKITLPSKLPNNLSVFLDGIQDPGNLGTIIRICDWFGIDHVFSSFDSVDWYNPKVIQASMGSFNRVKHWPCEFEEIKILAKNSGTSIFGAFMNGQNIYAETLPKNALLVMGNEGNGIREEIEAQIDRKISIPNLSQSNDKAESLNVSVAAAIICSEFKRFK
jgi:TrmH family RNA methyltransferase